MPIKLKDNRAIIGNLTKMTSGKINMWVWIYNSEEIEIIGWCC
jgi:hypothetical protein